MKSTPIITILLSALLALFAGVASASEPSSVHSKHPLSYYSLIMDPAPDAVERDLGQECVTELRKYFNQGKDFADERLIKSAKRVSEYQFKSGENVGTFYHHSGAEGVRDAGECHDFSPMLEYVRRDGQGRTGPLDIYVAEDPHSSASFGQYQVRFKLKPEALVTTRSRQWIEGANRMRRKLMFCEVSETFLHLVLEENGIALFDYFVRPNGKWFQLIRMDDVESFEPGVQGQR